MRNVSAKSFKENQNTHFTFHKPPTHNCAVYEMMWKNTAQRGRPQMTIWRMCIASVIPKVTNTHSQYVIITSFPIPRWSHKCTSILRYTYVGWSFNSGTDFFFREIIIRSEMATEWDTWQLCASVFAKPKGGISPHSLCGGPWVNVYNSLRRISRRRR